MMSANRASRREMKRDKNPDQVSNKKVCGVCNIGLYPYGASLKGTVFRCPKCGELTTKNKEDSK